MRFDSVADELYAATREEFTALRDERAAEAKAAGEQKLATRIRGLRKPTSAAWLANQLAREHADEIGKLEKLGEAMRRAHTELDGDELRTLSRRRHDLVQALTDQARSLGKARGTRISESVSGEVSGTLDAALGDPQSARALAEGRLATALHPGESSPERWLSAATVAPRKPRRGTATPSKPVRSKPAAGKPASVKEKARDKEDRQRAREAERAEAARLRVERANARKVVREAKAARDEAKKQLRDTERAEEQARKATAAARTDADKAERALEEAEQALAEFG